MGGKRRWARGQEQKRGLGGSGEEGERVQGLKDEVRIASATLAP